MLRSKRSQEGYLMIDHRASPGILAGEAPGAIPVGAGALFETSTITCSHCQKISILNPGRTRERGYCPKCDHYVCDQCETARVATGECKTFKQLMDEVETAVYKSHII
jgi:hypothetical protein